MRAQEQIQEYSFQGSDFSDLAKLVYDRTGIVLGDHKKDMVYARLVKRLRKLNIESFAQYLKLLKDSSDESELEQFINAITTNLTRFFREQHHFDHLRDVLVPEVQQNRQDKIRLWSAACASGPEPYSIAMTMHSALPNPKTANLKILATDLDTNMLDTARNGIYNEDSLKDIPAAFRTKYTNQVEGHKFQVKDEIRNIISFNRMNLMHKWPVKGPLDAIFCRNVLIYFNKQDKDRITLQLIEKLKVGGYLYMGHAESILNPPQGIKSVGPTTYKKVAQ